MRYTEPKMRLGELLLDHGVIDENQLKEALDVQARRGGRLAEILIRLQHIDYQTLEQVIATRPGVASVDLARYKLTSDLCHLIPEEFATQNLVFPIDKLGHTLTVAMAFPLDTDTIDAIRERTGLKVKAFYCKPAAIRAAIRRFYRPFGEVDWSELLSVSQRERPKPHIDEPDHPAH